MIGGLCIEFPIHHAVQQSRQIDIDLLIPIGLAVGFDSRRQIGVEGKKNMFSCSPLLRSTYVGLSIGPSPYRRRQVLHFR